MRLYSIEELEDTKDATKNSCMLFNKAIYLIGPIIDINNIGLTYDNTKNIERLNIASLQSEFLDTKMFDHCSKLKYIVIKDTNIEHLELKFLKDKKIKSLAIYGNRIKTIDLSPLEKMSELEMLDLSCNNFKRINIEPLRDLRKLKKLYLGGNKLEKIKLSYIQDIPIDILSFTTFSQEIKFDLEILYKMKNLKHISYSNPAFEGKEAIPHIKQKKPVTYIKQEHLYLLENNEFNYRCRKIETNNLKHERWNTEEFDRMENSKIVIRNEIHKIK